MVKLSLMATIVGSILLRLCFMVYGVYQDFYMDVKYTDIDYLVFSDAAKYVSEGLSPYTRPTYRYTPLLAWMLIPNSWGPYWYHFGKMVFVVCDVITGIIVLKLLQAQAARKQLSTTNVIGLSAIWLFNPMVITISTRGSSESVLTVMIMLSLYYVVEKRAIVRSAFWMGLAIHFKLYPVIYVPSVLLFIAGSRPNFLDGSMWFQGWINGASIKYAVVLVVTLGFLNGIFFSIYGQEFLENAFFYHFGRLDHRHNFSVYNMFLYYKSAGPKMSLDSFTVEKLAFVPQLLILSIVLPLTAARKNLMSSIFLQTFAFVMFNKVVTSQYFIWFLIFLPDYLSTSRLVTMKLYKRGMAMLLLWVLSQACWLFFAYKLEFLGENVFTGGLFLSSVFFFVSNTWILGNMVDDLAHQPYQQQLW